MNQQRRSGGRQPTQHRQIAEAKRKKYEKFNPQSEIRNPQSFDSLLSRCQKRPQHCIEWLIRAKGNVIDLLCAAPGPNAFHKRLNLSPISGLQAPRFGNYVSQRLEPLEHGHLLKWKINFRRVKHVQNDHIVPTMPQMLQPGEHRFDVVEQIAHDHDDPTPAETLGEVVKDRAGAGLSRRGRLLHYMQQLLELGWIAARPNDLADFLIERHEPDGIPLVEYEIRKGGCRALSVRKLRKRRVRPLILHALAGIEQQITKQVGFLFKLFQIEPVTLTEHFPIDIAQIIARRVLAMLGKFVREAAVGAAVKAGHIAFDNFSSAQLQSMQLCKRLRFKQRTDG
jgi:hypothetical protein